MKLRDRNVRRIGVAAASLSVLVLLAALVYLPAYSATISVDAGDGSCVSGSGQTNPYAVVYCGIQDAIDDAAAGDTVSVGAGTYVEDLVIPEGLTGLELAGAGSGSTTVQGVANVLSTSWPVVAPNIEVLADDVALHGFTLRGPDPVSGYYSSGMVIGGAGLEVYDNAFEVPNAITVDDISQGLQTYSGVNNPTAGQEVDGLNVHNNTFTDYGAGTFGFEGIYINPDTGDPTPGGALTLANNSFSGDVVRAITTERSNVAITGNTLGSDLPVADLLDDLVYTPSAWQGVNVAAAQDITLTGNTISGFWQQVKDGGGSLVFANVVADNTFDHSAYASSGVAIFWFIQDAIDDATAGDTVSVGRGTYDEQLVIGIQLTLNGNGTDVAGGTATILQPTAAPAPGEYDVEVNASGTILQSFVFDFNGSGATLADGSRSGNGIVVSDLNGPDVTGVEIKFNDIYTGDANTGIQTGKNADVSGLLVQNNDFYADATGFGEGVYINPLKAGSAGNVQVLDNTFQGLIFAGVSVEASDVIVRGNQIHSDVSKGLYGVRFIDITGGQTYSGVEIGGPSASDGNLIEAFQCGIRVGTTTDVGSSLTANIQWNDLRNNDVAICMKYGTHATFADNIFTGNLANIRYPLLLYFPLIAK